jgi:hypothetical protein
MFWFVCRCKQKGREWFGSPSAGVLNKTSLSLVKWVLVSLQGSKGSLRVLCDAVNRGLSGCPDVVSILRGKSGGEDDICVIPGQIIGLGDTERFLVICGGI